MYSVGLVTLDKIILTFWARHLINPRWPEEMCVERQFSLSSMLTTSIVCAEVGAYSFLLVLISCMVVSVLQLSKDGTPVLRILPYKQKVCENHWQSLTSGI